MVKNHSDSKRANQLPPPLGLLFSIVCVCVWGGGGGAELFPCPYQRFRHAHHETKNRQPGLGSRGSFSISSKGSFICTIPQRRYHRPRPLLHQSWNTGWNEKLINGSTMKDRSNDLPRSYISLPLPFTRQHTVRVIVK